MSSGLRRHLCAVVVLGVTGSACVTTSASGPASTAAPDGKIYRVDLARDMVAIAAMLGVALIVRAETDAWAGWSPCPEFSAPLPADPEEALRFDPGVCDERALNAVDRFARRFDSETADLLSDALALSLIAAPYAASGIGASAASELKPGLRAAEDALVTTQALAGTILATSVLKVGVRRPRPYAYNREVPIERRFSAGARLSFPSGHTSMSFAAASVLTATLLQRHGAGLGPVLGSAAAFTMATAVGALRIAAGRHFFSDVVIGAALGAVMGFGVSAVHLEGSGTEPTSTIAERPVLLSFGGGW